MPPLIGGIHKRGISRSCTPVGRVTGDSPRCYLLATDPVPTDKWDAYLDASRPVALMTRPGVMVQIILTNQKGEEKLVTRYLYDEDLSAE